MKVIVPCNQPEEQHDFDVHRCDCDGRRRGHNGARELELTEGKDLAGRRILYALKEGEAE